MGFDPPQLGEAYEICIELEGAVGETAFREFERKLRDCIKELGRITDADHGNARLKVRKIKTEVTPKP